LVGEYITRAPAVTAHHVCATPKKNFLLLTVP
jgi:hypothetical protein